MNQIVSCLLEVEHAGTVSDMVISSVYVENAEPVICFAEVQSVPLRPQFSLYFASDTLLCWAS